MTVEKLSNSEGLGTREVIFARWCNVSIQHALSHQHKEKSTSPMVAFFVSWDKKWGKYPKNTLIFLSLGQWIRTTLLHCPRDKSQISLLLTQKQNFKSTVLKNLRNYQNTSLKKNQGLIINQYLLLIYCSYSASVGCNKSFKHAIL